MKDGIHTLAFAAYAEAPGVSNSMLKDIGAPNSPLHFWAKHVAKTVVQEETEAMRTGSALHRVLLEPDTLDGAFYISPEGMDFRTKAGKEWKAVHADREVISNNLAKDIQGMRDAVWSHPMAKRLLAGAEMERSLFATDSNGILRKGRLDALNAGNIIADVKTIGSADLETVEKNIAKFRYYVQLPYYRAICNLLGMEKEAGVLIFVEKTAPYDVVCYQIQDDVMELGKMVFERDLALFRDCREKNRWPGRSSQIESAGLPGWMMRQLEQLQ